MGTKLDLETAWAINGNGQSPTGSTPLSLPSETSGTLWVESLRDLHRRLGHYDECNGGSLGFSEPGRIQCFSILKDHNDLLSEQTSGSLFLIEGAFPELTAPMDGRLHWEVTVEFRPGPPRYIQVKGGGVRVGAAAAIYDYTPTSFHTAAIPDIYDFEGNDPPPTDWVTKHFVCEVGVRRGTKSRPLVGLPVYMFARNGARIWLDQGQFDLKSAYEYRPGYPGDWVAYSGGDLPSNALVGGQICGSPYPMYVGRAYHGESTPGTHGNAHPGKIAFSEGRWSCFIGNGGKEQRYEQFEVLVSNSQVKYYWQPVTNALPVDAVVGGYAIDNQFPLYIGRGNDGGNVHPGKVVFSDDRWSCFIGNGGVEQRFESFEVLCMSA